MNVLILGGDGYLGWPASMHLSANGWSVGIVDNFARRRYDDELGTSSLLPIQSLGRRVDRWAELSGRQISCYEGDLTDPEFVDQAVATFRPDAVVHFAEQRSAPYSMIDQAHATYTQQNNVIGTLNLLWSLARHVPEAHLVKLGTMGEYGTPNIDIEEGFLEVNHKGRTDVLPYPMQPGSFYHLSKLHDSNNIRFACRAWGLRATDLHQGIVYGAESGQSRLHPDLATRFDYDGIFGTVLNRFIVQAMIGHPVTVYGDGGQTRGCLDIRDTLACVELALRHPAAAGEYRVFNQFTETFSVRRLAEIVADLSPVAATVERVPNPRVEAEAHYYNAAHSKLQDLGLRPHLLSEALVRSLFDLVALHAGRVNPDVIRAKVSWRADTGTAVGAGLAPLPVSGPADSPPWSYGRQRARRPSLAT